MAISGKYNFKGIKALGGAGIRAALLASPYTAWLARIPALSTFASEFIANWLANNGLIVLNLGSFYIGGEFDQAALDKAIEAGLTKIQNGNLTPKQMKEIDDAVIRAADKALPYSSRPSSS